MIVEMRELSLFRIVLNKVFKRFSMQEFIITFRETLEAALIVGIFYTFFSKLKAPKASRTLWQAVAAAVVASFLFAWGLNALKAQFQDSAFEKLFEAVLMYLAAGFLIYMVVWMGKNVNVKSDLENKARASLDDASQWSIFLLVFFAIVREGFETVLFLIGGDSGADFSYLGFVGGIVLAIGIGVLIFVQGKRVKLKPFFNVTSVLLILFAAGMVAYGTHEMEEYLVKSGTLEEASISRVWDVNHPVAETPSNPAWYSFNEGKGKYYHHLHDKGKVGVFLKGFFGWNSDPNWVELLLWLLTLGGAFYLWKRPVKPA